MPLEMRTNCERCDAQLQMDADARICSYECTWCPNCADSFGNICPNCGGELVRRPVRRSSGENSR
ncbi:MAG: DUF1272 domain-containing protein [Chloroflexi bacterium]|nr:DUF1272 domain-containing protein [Chloroflexota bacterium]